MTRKLPFAVLLVLVLALLIGGCGGAGGQVSRNIPRGIAAADQAINGVDDIARRVDLPEAAIRTPTASSRSAAAEVQAVVNAPELSPEDRELVWEGGCAILDFVLRFAAFPTGEQIDTWIFQQGVEVVSYRGIVIRQKLNSVVASLQDGQLSTEEYAEVSALVCEAPIL